MASWNEIEPKYKLVIIIVAFLVVAGGVWYAFVRPVVVANRVDNQTLQSKKAEIAQLMPFQSRIIQLNREIDTLHQQIELQKQIVPEEKQVDGFIRMVQSEAHSSGIEIRRFTAMPVAAREFYSEMPFELEIDGPYYAVVHFFEQVSKADRIVNISGVHMANVKNPSQAKAKKTYIYAPSETVVATCVATTFFSSAAQPVNSPAPARKK